MSRDVPPPCFRTKHKGIYSVRSECERYDMEVCKRQDYEGNILRTILSQQLRLSRDTRVLDLGAGTGKLSRLLAPLVGPIVALDRESSMCHVGQASLAREGQPAVGFAVADQRSIPLRDGCVELVIAGWSVSAIKSEVEEWNHASGTAHEVLLLAPRSSVCPGPTPCFPAQGWGPRVNMFSPSGDW